MSRLAADDRDDDLTDTITRGTWRVDYFIENGDDHTSLFSGYVFTFLADGTVTVTRPGAPPPVGYWNEYNNGTRIELDFGGGFPLEKLTDDLGHRPIQDDELNFHELDAPSTQLRLRQTLARGRPMSDEPGKKGFFARINEALYETVETGEKEEPREAEAPAAREPAAGAAAPAADQPIGNTPELAARVRADIAGRGPALAQFLASPRRSRRSSRRSRAGTAPR